MSSEFYENIYNRWVISWYTREELLGVYSVRRMDYSTNKGVALLAYVESFLNQAPEDNP